jgi:hypothetical protein
VLLAIRENEQRARFRLSTNRYKLIGFVLSAVVVAVAGTLSVFNHRFASAEPLSVAFSGELIAMVVIGGMRSFLGPALGALFFILFREFLSIWTPHWLFYFGLLFIGFVVFSPTGLVGVGERLLAPIRKREITAAAMAGRKTAEVLSLPRSLLRANENDRLALSARNLEKSFGGIHAVRGFDLSVRDKTLHALIGPNGAARRRHSMFWPYAPDAVPLSLRKIHRRTCRRTSRERCRPLVSDHQFVRWIERRGKYPSCHPGALAHALRNVALDRFAHRYSGRDCGTHPLPWPCRDRKRGSVVSFLWRPARA